MRYAIYYLPERESALAEFGASWLGWDVSAGEAIDHPQLSGLPGPISVLTDAPRKYGFHATLKAPFYLAPGKTLNQLSAELYDLGQDFDPVPLGQLQVTNHGGFLALTPRKQTRALHVLEEECVTRLDRFRAPLTEQDRARRLAADLSDRHKELLRSWGYPYVLDQFRFHLTLTGRLEDADAETAALALRQALAPILQDPFWINSLCLCAETSSGRFRLIERVPLSAE